MNSTSIRARAVRARIAEWWANVWRWMLLAAGTALGVYLLLDRGVRTGSSTAVRSAPRHRSRRHVAARRWRSR